jgi:hypothetical protein
VSFATITLCVASQQVLIAVSMYFFIDSVRKLLDTPSYCYKLVTRNKAHHNLTSLSTHLDTASLIKYSASITIIGNSFYKLLITYKELKKY